MATRCITAINRALARVRPCITERLYRSPAGYYYLSGGDVFCSIYVFALDPEDFNFAAKDINDAFRAAGKEAPLLLRPQ